MGQWNRGSGFRVWLAVSVLLGVSMATAQGPPSTDIFQVTLEGEGDEKPTFGEPVNLTNRDGYDNQPSFLPDGSGILYTSIRGDQADIYLYDLETSKTTQVTETSSSEYSPTPTDGGRSISVIRQFENGQQILWSFPLGEGDARVLLPGVNPVGYHAWSSDGGLLLFVLGEPHTLQWWTPESDPRVVASDIGRSLLPIPGTRLLSFVHKDGKEEWWLKSFDPESGQIAGMIATLSGREDLAWDPGGKAWMADGGRLYRYCPDCGGGWRRIVDFGRSGIQEISRLAFSPDGKTLAFVAERPAASSESQ